MQKIIPNLWFDTQAQEAAQFYTSIFNDSSIGTITHYPESGFEVHGMQAGTVLTVEFSLSGLTFVALNGGPQFTFTPAISFMVHCASPEEVDDLYGKLSDGGTVLMPLDAYPFSKRYAWISDKYGLSWQIIHTEEPITQKIVPSLMYAGALAGNAEAAINFYTSLFPNSQIGTLARYGADQAPDTEGTIMYADFTLASQRFAAMDSAHAHQFTFNEAVSLLVMCENQAEIDRLWSELSAVPEAEQCGWLKDKFGVSWQISPKGMEIMLNDPDTAKVNRMMEAMLQMKKIDMAKLNEAFAG